MKFLIVFFYPISYPISKILDYCFGADEESSNIAKVELEALILIQNSNTMKKSNSNNKISSSGSSRAIENKVKCFANTNKLSDKEVRLSFISLFIDTLTYLYINLIVY